jgi:hypothetical protein
MRGPARTLVVALVATLSFPVFAAAQTPITPHPNPLAPSRQDRAASGERESEASQPARDDATTQTTQRRSPPARPPRPPGEPRLLEIAGFAHFGQERLAATRSFDAILGSHAGTVVGGGGEVTFRRGLLRGVFARVDVSRFEETGERVFVFDGRVFPLGIPATITLTPMEVTAGYRLLLPRRGGSRPFPITPYGGIGVGSLSYRETSTPAQPGDDVDERFTSWHVVGGADVRVWRWIGVGVEGLYRRVPDALGTSGVSEAFDESNLNGATLRVRVRAAF